MELKKNTEVYFDDLTHTYLLGEKELTGVTTLMKQMGLAPDYSDIPEDVLQNAADRGSAVHRAIETYCKYGEGVIDSRYADEVISALKAFKTLGIRPVENEYLVSDNESIASSIDLVAEAGEKVDLVDIKTTSSLHKESVAWQLTIYRWLFRLANPDIEVDRLWCLHIRDGVAKMVEVAPVAEEELQKMLRCFREGEPYVQESLTVPEDQAVAVNRIAELEKAIVDFEGRIKEFKAQQEKLKGGIIALMRSHNLKKWVVSDQLSFTYIEPTSRISIDSTRLKKEMPDIFNAFLKESQVKEALRINIKA